MKWMNEEMKNSNVEKEEEKINKINRKKALTRY